MGGYKRVSNVTALTPNCTDKTRMTLVFLYFGEFVKKMLFLP